MPQIDTTKPRFWRSVEDFTSGDNRPKAAHGYPELVGREFPVGATEIDGATRRDFLKLVGLTAAGTMAAGCMRNPPERILPYVRQPADIRPGIPLHYATSMSHGGYGVGLLVTSREGRPIKVEGNPDHPASFGASGTFEQALAYGVYDPQRGKAVKRRAEQSGWKSFVADVQARITAASADGGKKIVFLDGPTASPFDGWLRKQVVKQLPEARFVSYTGLDRDAVFDGTEIAFGQRLEVRHDFDKARVVLALDDDFLESGPDRLLNARHFARHRVPEPEGAEGAASPGGEAAEKREPAGEWMNRLYVAECGYSVTGGQADHRLRVRGSEIVAVAAALFARIVPEAAADVAALAAPFKDHKWVAAVAKDLASRGPQAVVTVGTNQPAEVHAMVAAINSTLKSEVVEYGRPLLLDTKSGTATLKDIVAQANAGEIDTLVITAWNPVYAAPADVPFADALKKIPNVVYYGQFEDETSVHAHWYIPATHELESWGDSTSIDGTVAIQQPLIAPLFNGVQRGELFGAFAGMPDRTAHELLREAHSQHSAEVTANGGFDAWWERVLQKGVLSPAPPDTVTPTLATGKVTERLRPFKFERIEGIEVNYVVDNKVHDGRYGDNAWLQELPEPLTKVVWGNVGMISPKMADRLGLAAEEIVKITVDGRTIDIPLFVLPGHADDAISIAIGYGRTGGEAIARGVGSNANVLRTTAAPWFGAQATLAKTGKSDRLGITQEHWAMEGRPIALTAELAEVKRKHLPMIESQNGPQPSMMDEWPNTTPEGYRWAMAIDMAKCTGCNACILACESENNILIVGKDQVRRGREMHWLRVDRYFEEVDGSLDDAKVVVQPMACVQCEKAPCEYVCPVNATVHSDEGLNDMVYNRCVGTRYCANNCPYKVRRFNYLNWHNNLQGTYEMKMNPDVTVRARGVIEKCTYCVQRIEQARIATRTENHGVGRVIKDGEIVTACQQSCASGAITFGSLHDPKSEVSKKHADERAYAVLWELNTRPRTRHLAKVRNPNPELA